jgi:magnesium chelatase family protein
VLNTLSGPLLDRMDIHIEVPAVNYRDLSAGTSGDPSTKIKQRVEYARAIQRDRLKPNFDSCDPI